jgi:hypothetical protein
VPSGCFSRLLRRTFTPSSNQAVALQCALSRRSSPSLSPLRTLSPLLLSSLFHCAVPVQLPQTRPLFTNTDSAPTRSAFLTAPQSLGRPEQNPPEQNPRAEPRGQPTSAPRIFLRLWQGHRSVCLHRRLAQGLRTRPFSGRIRLEYGSPQSYPAPCR